MVLSFTARITLANIQNYKDWNVISVISAFSTNSFFFRGVIHKSDIVESWSTLFLGSDRSVALHTQRFLYEKYNERPVQVRTYMTFKLV